MIFDFAQHGPIHTHRYRSYFDAHPGSTNQCAFCGRTIRFCYAMKDQYEKTFLIGTCDFYHYKGTEAYTELKAARVLQKSYLRSIQHDTKHFGDKSEVRENRKAWSKARRTAEKQIRTWVMVNGQWLPKPLFDLQQATGQRPKPYKRQSSTARWYEKQIEKLNALTKGTSSI